MGLSKANSTSFKKGNIPWSKGKKLISLVGNKHGVTHGKYNTTIYRIWVRMKSRCYNPKDKVYKDYGGRGIKVSNDWLKFENWFRDIGERPSSKHTLERINNNFGYSKENCRWATMKEQGQNRRSNVYIEFKGKTKTISQWAEEIGLSHSSLSKRLRNWNLERALTEKKYANKI